LHEAGHPDAPEAHASIHFRRRLGKTKESLPTPEEILDAEPEETDPSPWRFVYAHLTLVSSPTSNRWEPFEMSVGRHQRRQRASRALPMDRILLISRVALSVLLIFRNVDCPLSSAPPVHVHRDGDSYRYRRRTLHRHDTHRYFSLHKARWSA
jgi:hypothetical protein